MGKGVKEIKVLFFLSVSRTVMVLTETVLLKQQSMQSLAFTKLNLEETQNDL